MSELQFPDLHIQGFRGIKDLEVPRLGRVTLITGKNNTGKSSVLEALRLYTQNATPPAVYSILTSREEYIRGMDEEDSFHDSEDMFHVSALFHGFPRLSDDFGPIVISTSGRSRRMELRMEIDWFVEDVDSDEIPRLLPRQQDLFEEPELVPALITQTEDVKRIWALDSMRRQARLRRGPRPRPSDRARMPCIFVGSYGGAGMDTLGELWDKITLTENEKHVVDALRLIDPRISAINMVGGEGPSKTKKAIVQADHISRPVPLRSFGDGMNRLFAIILSLVNARGGLLLVDEFENGLHYTVQLDAWRMIFQLAQKLDVQVFATTHSQDTIATFQKASSESPEEGMYLRLSRWRDGVIHLAWGEEELASAIRASIEMR